MERVGGRQEKMEGNCSTGQSPQWAVPMEEEEENEGKKEGKDEEKEVEEEEEQPSHYAPLQNTSMSITSFQRYI